MYGQRDSGKQEQHGLELDSVLCVSVCACMSLAAVQTSAVKVKFQSVWNQSMEPAAEHPSLPSSAALSGTHTHVHRKQAFTNQDIFHTHWHKCYIMHTHAWPKHTCLYFLLCALDSTHNPTSHRPTSLHAYIHNTCMHKHTPTHTYTH